MTTEDLRASDVLASAPADPLAKSNGNGGGSGAQAYEPSRHRRKDGTTIDVDVYTNDVTIDARECAIALYDDVTERNRVAAEALRAHDQVVEASNMKSAFLANVSHEVRTPMNGVIGMTELLLQTRLDEEQRTYAAQIEQSSEQALVIINDILDISKIETGHLALDVTDFDLVETIKETCSAAGALARAKGLRLDLQIDSDVPTHVRGDGRRLHQVLANLLANAVKFTAAGMVAVHVSATATARDGTELRVVVADSGIGIEGGVLERMFEPFTQADVSTTRLYGGTGLGLAIAREIVELMGGTITADSTPGHGSTFRFAVPLEAPAGLVTISAPSPAQTSATAPAWASPPLVLVAEDSKINQIVATRLLERCGCRVEVVADGREALRALAGRHYDAVLMDCQMPNVDGYQATAELRRAEGDTRHTPVIAMTAHAMQGDRERCIEAGMDDYISKPVRHADLINALRRRIPLHTDQTSQPPPQAKASSATDGAGWSLDGTRVLP
jgi:signal transduction histidine kinase/FixJ family two-component response regulator